MTTTPRLPGRVQRLLDRAHPYYHTIPTADRARLLHLPFAATAEEVDEVTALFLAATVLELQWNARNVTIRANPDATDQELFDHGAAACEVMEANGRFHRARLALVTKYTPTAEMNP